MNTVMLCSLGSANALSMQGMGYANNLSNTINSDYHTLVIFICSAVLVFLVIYLIILLLNLFGD